MKTRNIFLLALTALFTASCHSWDAPADGAGMDSYGNKNIQGTNIKKISEIKKLYKTEINGNSLAEVTTAMQIQGIIIGNDEGSNLYKQLYIKDETGALCLSIDKSGLYTSANVGQCVMVDLLGLYIGGYGKQGQVGVYYLDPTKENPTPSVGRMSRYVWDNHYKLIPPIAGLDTNPEEQKFSLVPLDIEENCGKLVTLKGVEFKDADGTAVYAPNDGSVTLMGGCANRPIKNFSNMLVRTSTYAKFAQVKLPTGRVDITGIASRYNDAWQIMMRTPDDIRPTTLADNDLPPVTEATGSGTQADPFNVIGAFNYVKDLKSGGITEKDVYIKGFVCKVDKSSFNSQYGNIDYYISDDADGLSSCFYVYRGLGLNKSKFTSADDIKIGDEVVVTGKITNYNGTIEYQSNSTNKNWLVSIKKAPDPSYYSADFTNGQGDFIIDNKEIGSLTSVWNADSKGYMKASAYVSSKNNAAESWLVSPSFSLKAAATPVMTFTNACNFINSGTITDHIKVMVYDGANWSEATISNLPDGKSWTFVDSTVDLKSVAGKEGVKIAFKYVSTTEIAPTWEIKTVSIK